jgi:hypothetical protein
MNTDNGTGFTFHYCLPLLSDSEKCAGLDALWCLIPLDHARLKCAKDTLLGSLEDASV